MNIVNENYCYVINPFDYKRSLNIECSYLSRSEYQKLYEEVFHTWLINGLTIIKVYYVLYVSPGVTLSIEVDDIYET